MGFSSILDISSFFIGMIINLIFVALMCYYFKRKYDYLEVAQNEQAKILYQLIHKPSSCPVPTMDFTHDPLVHPVIDSDSDSDSDSECDNECDNEMDNVSEETNAFTETVSDSKHENIDHKVHAEIIDFDSEVRTVELEQGQDPLFKVSVEEVKQEESMDITIQLVDNDSNYSKMSMKQLKDVLSSKGIKPKNNMKKDELLELITNEIKA